MLNDKIPLQDLLLYIHLKLSNKHVKQETLLNVLVICRKYVFS